MSRYPLATFTFLMVLITFLAIRQSVGVFGSGGHIALDPEEEMDYKLSLNRAFLPPASVTKELGRAAELVDEAWRRAILFEKWQMDYTASQYDILRATTRAETDLIGARFHVANAEVFTDAMHQNERAIKELGRADLLLQDAQTTVEFFMTPALHSVRVEIEAAEANERTDAALSTVRFETIRHDIDLLIDTLHASKSERHQPEAKRSVS